MAPMLVTPHEIERTLSNPSASHAELSSLLSAFTTTLSAASSSTPSLLPSLSPLLSALLRRSTTEALSKASAKLVFLTLSKCITDRTTGPTSRKSVLLIAANALLKLYFRIPSVPPSQFDSILRNLVASGMSFREYPASQRVTYRYYLGRYYLSQQQFRRARAHFLYCLRHFPTSSSHQRHRPESESESRNLKILVIYLTVSSLPLGLSPPLSLLHRTNLTNYFGPLIHHMKQGDLAGFHRHLKIHEAWFERYRISLILEHRCELILFRCLFRRTFLLASEESDSAAAASGGGGGGGSQFASRGTRAPPNVKLSTLLAALRYASSHRHVPTDPDESTSIWNDDGEEEWELQDVENLVVTMIEAGYIKGYLHHGHGILVLANPKLSSANANVSTVPGALENGGVGVPGFPELGKVGASQVMQNDDVVQFGE